MVEETGVPLLNQPPAAIFILQLHETTVQSRDGNVDKIHLKIFERNLGYRHNDIYLAPELPDIVRLV